MGLDIYFKEDIKNILSGVEFANAHLAKYCREDEVQAYRDGFRAALVATAVSFGIHELRTRVEVHRLEARTVLPAAARQP